MSFTIIGELINTTRARIRDAVAQRDVKTLQQLVTLQQINGAGYIDVNTGAGVHTERRDMQWLIQTVQEVASVPLCIDSPDPNVLESAWELLTRPPMINSISLEKNRFDRMLEVLKGKDCRIIALCMDDTGMPKTADQIYGRADQIVNRLLGIGVKPGDIWIDPLVTPVSTDIRNGLTALDAVAAIKKNIPGVKTVCGLSNISFGLPARRIVNRMFLALMMHQGLDGALLDPLDQELRAALKTTRMLLGKDEYCLGFMDSISTGMIPGKNMGQMVNKPDKRVPGKESENFIQTLIMKKGQTLAAALADAGLPVRSDCGGMGRCGQCRIQVQTSEALSPPTAAETSLLTPLQIETGYRLACQAVSRQAQPIALCRTGHEPVFPEQKITPLTGPYHGGPVGVAVDLGTTNIEILLCDLDTGASLVRGTEKNAQKCHGDDVISRIFAAGNPGIGRVQMQTLAVQTINRLTASCLETLKIRKTAVSQVTLAGNTTMTLILAGLNPESLGRYPYLPEIIEFPLYTAQALGFCLPAQTPVYLFPAVSGFIGGDTVSALVAHGVFDRDKTCLLVDIGTNGEIVLFHRNRFLAASCATGPAFEGARISCSMPAMDGAIDQMRFERTSARFVWHVIGCTRGVKPIGICGSGLVAALDGLVEAGILSPSGLLDKNSPLVSKTDQGVRVELVPAESTRDGRALSLSQKDIGELQLAKAAIFAGIELLLLRSGTTRIDLTILTGAFGSGFDYKKAVAVGMLPNRVKTGKVVLSPGLVGKGAVMALVNPETRKHALALSRQIEILELGGDPEFKEHFLSAMAFPTQMETT